MALGNYIVRDLDVNINHLSNSERKCLEHLIEAAQPIDTIYWKQKSEYGLAIKNLFEKVIMHAEPEKKPLFEEYLEYIILNNSFYDTLNNEKKFFPRFSKEDLIKAIESSPNEKGKLRNELAALTEPIFSKDICPEKPKGANIYDKGITKEMLKKASKDKELEKEIRKLNTEIRLDKDKIRIVPYEEVHKVELEKVSSCLVKASEHASGTFKRYLLSRSKALLDGEYRKSDEDWIDVEGNLNIVVGPIETYIDGILGQKAAYQAMICIKDAEETAKLTPLKSLAIGFEGNLPCSDKYKKEKVIIPPPEVVQTILNTGEAGGIATPVAWILPNDEKIRKEKGYRIAFSKNINYAKSCLEESIDKRILDDEDLKLYGKSLKDAFQLYVFLHELGHTNGKVKDELKLTPQEALEEHSSTIDEAKADILALYHLDFLKSKGFITGYKKGSVYYSLLSYSFRHFKSGLEGDHTRACALFLNYLMEKQGIKIKNNRYKIDIEKATEAVRSLAQKLLIINGEGNYNEADSLIKRYVFLSPEAKETIAKMKDLPDAVVIKYPKLEF